jgi:hypothetical protein
VQVDDIALEPARMLKHHRRVLFQKPLPELLLILSRRGADQGEELHA